VKKEGRTGRKGGKEGQEGRKDRKEGRRGRKEKGTTVNGMFFASQALTMLLMLPAPDCEDRWWWWWW
jgi:hypothetical protein